ncbi:alpha/beta-hydrolase [Athelia psychrophila]|uniref:Alpha/beta-hydrolase n=1 Tax=Athelia psychrophila TaxID=1759441 RepID=A0A166PC22_9AGAM|nr:alpha/beta-hydrolase [Fibularhizoctonia sp. CBS 109695]
MGNNSALLGAGFTAIFMQISKATIKNDIAIIAVFTASLSSNALSNSGASTLLANFLVSDPARGKDRTLDAVNCQYGLRTLQGSHTFSCGINYHYYFSPARDSNLTTPFLHGFPSTSYDWRHQAAFFKGRGFDVIVPDLLGYGGTAKPDALAEYVPSKIVRDIVDILDAEGVEKVVSIGHDSGTLVNSRLGNYFPERVIALAFFNLGYLPPFFTADFAALSAATKAAVGYECFGYWPFFNEDDADEIIEDHLDSFLSVNFSNDPTLLKTDMAPLGALKAWLMAGRMAPFCAYIPDEEMRVHKDLLSKGGFKGPLNWYKVVMRGFTAEDDKLIPQEHYAISQPVFFGGCKLDYICRPEIATPALDAYAKRLTYREFDGDHWTLLSHSEDVNSELLSWITTAMQVL